MTLLINRKVKSHDKTIVGHKYHKSNIPIFCFRFNKLFLRTTEHKQNVMEGEMIDKFKIKKKNV